MSETSFSCPVCGRTSWNATDVRERYCARCHGVTTSAPPGWRWVLFKTSDPRAHFGRLISEHELEIGWRYEQIGEGRSFVYDGVAFVEVEYETREAR